MLLPSQSASSRARTLKLIFLVSSVALFFLFYQGWSHYDQLSFRLIDFQILRQKSIPRKIWYKLGPKGKSDEVKEWTDSCINQNPNYRYEFMTDPSADAYVERRFGASRPDIVEVYLNLTVPILKADLLRYLLLFAEGGVWSDLDVSCEGIPIDEWIPEEHREQTSLLVGWEFDAGWDDSYIHEFASWTIMSKPGVPHMGMVIDDIIRAVHDTAAEHHTTISGLNTGMVGDIVDFTGPRRLTRSILKSLELTLGKPVDRHHIEQIREPVRVSDVLILPGYAFSSLTNHFDESDGPLGPTLVMHHYAGTWKNEYGGELAKRR